MFVDGDVSILTERLRIKLNDFAKTKTDADVAKKINTITIKIYENSLTESHTEL